MPPPCHLTPECYRSSRQIPADSLGRSKSNGVLVDLFRSTVDLPGQVKLKKFRFPGKRSVNLCVTLSDRRASAVGAIRTLRCSG